MKYLNAIVEINPAAVTTCTAPAGATAQEEYDAIQWLDGTAVIAKATLDAKITEITTRDAHIQTRRNSYPPMDEQLDKLYHEMTAGKGDKTGTWYASIKAVKDATPKA